MRKFWKDYADLCKASGKFYKKLRNSLKETIKDKFGKKNKEEESE